MREALAVFLRSIGEVERAHPDPWKAARQRLRADPDAVLVELERLAQRRMSAMNDCGPDESFNARVAAASTIEDIKLVDRGSDGARIQVLARPGP